MLVTFVIPVFNEEQNIAPLHNAIKEAAGLAGVEFEAVFVNDGSSDRTLDEIKSAVDADGRVTGVNLSRNFGLQAAVTAGLSIARGDVVMLIDGDMQDDPRHLPGFLEKWREGYKVVYAVRASRRENWYKRFLFKMFYRIQHIFSETNIPLDAGLFSLLDGAVVKEMNRLGERNRYLPGLRAWVGFKAEGILIDRDPRLHGEPRMSIFKLVAMAMDAIISFTIKPLRLANYLGCSMMLVSLGVICFILYSKFVSFKAIPGWASQMTAMLVLFGVVFFIQGVMGEYVGRIYNEVKNRPVFIIETVIRRQDTSDKK